MSRDGGIISVTMGKLGKPPTETRGDEGDDEDKEPDSEAPSMAFLSASDELFDAIKNDDKGKFAETLKNAIETCVMDYEDREGDHDEGDDEEPPSSRRGAKTEEY